MRKDREGGQKGGCDDAKRSFSSLTRTCLIGLSERDKQDVAVYRSKQETNLKTDLTLQRDMRGKGQTKYAACLV